ASLDEEALQIRQLSPERRLTRIQFEEGAPDAIAPAQGGQGPAEEYDRQRRLRLAQLPQDHGVGRNVGDQSLDLRQLVPQILTKHLPRALEAIVVHWVLKDGQTERERFLKEEPIGALFHALVQPGGHVRLERPSVD